MNSINKIDYRTIKWLFALTITAMAISGFGQMPIFKRYYIADIPGLSWTADYYITHNIHYTGAVVLLSLSAYLLTEYFLSMRKKIYITVPGYIIIFSLSGLILSGVFKVISNQKGIYFGKTALLSLDLLHTIFTFLFLILAGLFRLRKFQWFEKTGHSGN